MNTKIDIKRLTLFFKIGAAYLLVWVLYDLTNHPSGEFQQRAVNEVWRAVYIVLANYWFFEHALPALQFSWKGLPRNILLLGSQFLLYSFGLYAWRYLGILLHIHTSFKEYETIPDGACDQFSASMFSVFFFAVIRHIYDHIKLKQSAQQLLIEKQQAELNYLKSQTNPHFLFNTLNNIYSLASDKSDLAPESILRLSKILRFMLYETSGKQIGIEQEVKVISDYIALEKLRHDESLRVSFTYDIEDMKHTLPPLLLIPLVENAFKHGAAETRRLPFVDIHLSVDKRQLFFCVKNSVEKPAEEGSVKENIGLSNLRRQLELLYTDYKLTVQRLESEFVVVLKINLSSHV